MWKEDGGKKEEEMIDWELEEGSFEGKCHHKFGKVV